MEKEYLEMSLLSSLRETNQNQPQICNKHIINKYKLDRYKTNLKYFISIYIVSRYLFVHI